MNKVCLCSIFDMTYVMHSAGCTQIIPHVQSEEYDNIDCDDQVSALTSEGSACFKCT